MGILLSPKHGVNPSVTMCFWCGKESTGLVLFGRLKGDAEAPRQTVMDLEPCDKCKAMMASGITFIEVVESAAHAGHNLQLQPGVYHTSKWWVIEREVVERSLQPPELRQKILEQGKALLLPEDAEALGLYKALGKEGKTDEG